MAPAAPSLVFAHSSRSVRRRELRRFLETLSCKLAPRNSETCLVATCLITSDAELRRLNRDFRNKDYATDVLSFPSGEGSGPGELAISLDRAREQADALGHTLEEELRILILHGLLHLCGMDHERDSGEMARAEALWRKRLGLPRGLIERARS